MHRPICVLSLACLAAIISALPAPQDSVGLKTGQCDGIVYEITVKVQDKLVTCNRLHIVDAALDNDRNDSIKLDDGTAILGAVDNLRIKSIGGLLTYKRDDISSVSINPKALDDLHKDYLQRRYSVSQASPEDLLKLAKWCLDKNLKPEALELARMTIEADEYSAAADEAHDILGEVWDVDKWVQKPSAVSTSPAETTEPAAQTPADPATAQARDAAMAQYQKFYAEYSAKLAAANAKDFKAFVGKYKPPIDKASARIKADKAKIDALTKTIQDLLNNKIPNADPYGKELPALNKKLDAAQHDLDAAQQDYPAAIAAQKAAVDSAAQARDAVVDRASVRIQKLDDVRTRIPKLVNDGSAPTVTQMRAMFDLALK